MKIEGAVSVTGQTAHDSAVSGTPVRVAGRAVTANYNPVATGDTADLVTTTVGTLITRPFSIPELSWQFACAAGGVTVTTDQVLKGAAAAGIRNYVTNIQLINAHATQGTEVVIKDGSTTVIWRGNLPANSRQDVIFITPLRGTAATAMNIACVTAATVYISGQGFQAP